MGDSRTGLRAGAAAGFMLVWAIAGCGRTVTSVKSPPPARAVMTWSACPHPVMGIGCELPDSWRIDEGDHAAVANAKSSGDDALVLFVALGGGDARPDAALRRYLPLAAFTAAGAERARKLKGGEATESRGVARLEGKPARDADVVLVRATTAKGAVLVVLLTTKAASPEARAFVARIGESLTIAEPPKPPPPPVVRRDLAGRPIGGERPGSGPTVPPGGDDEEEKQ